jgi:hypothetical protein
MAMGTVTVLKKGVLGPGGVRFALVEVQPTAGANYVTGGGEAIGSAATFGFKRGIVHAAFTQPKVAADRSHVYELDQSNFKLSAYVVTTGVEAGNNVDLSAKRVRIFIIGS